MTTTEEARVSVEELFPFIMRSQATLDALAALGAKLSAAPGDIPAEVAEAIDNVLEAAGVPPVDDLEPPQRQMLSGIIRTTFGQSSSLLNEPGRDAGWLHTDPVVLEGQGRGSMIVPGLIAQSFPDVTSFLDVGTGVGLLAVAAAQVWPSSTIVGVDVWGPSLERARANIAGAGLTDRVEIRDQSVLALEDTDRFDLVWLPSFFINRGDTPAALERIRRATAPGGTIVVGRYDPPPDPLLSATARLRVLRDGGAWLAADEVVDLLTASGWTDASELPRQPGPLALIAATKP